MPKAGEFYRHYKGGVYQVITIGMDTETKTPVVVYRSLKYGSVWCRPLSVWNSKAGRYTRFKEMKIR